MITTTDLKSNVFIKQLTEFLNSSRFKQEITYLMLLEKSAIETEKKNIRNSNQLLDYLYNISNTSSLFNDKINIVYNVTTNSLRITKKLEADEVVILDRNFYNKSMNKAWFSFIKSSNYIVPEETLQLIKDNILKFVKNKQQEMFESLLEETNEQNSFLISANYFQNLEFDSEIILNHISYLLKNNQFEDVFNYLNDLTINVKFDFIHLILTHNFNPEKHLNVLNELFYLSKNNSYIKELFFLKLFEIQDFKTMIDLMVKKNYWSHNFIRFALDFLSENEFNEDMNTDLIFESIEGFHEIFKHAKKDVIEIIQDKKQHDTLSNVSNLFNLAYQANKMIQDDDLTESLQLTLDVKSFKALLSNSVSIEYMRGLLKHNILHINMPQNIKNESIYKMIGVFTQYEDTTEYNQIIDILKEHIS